MMSHLLSPAPIEDLVFDDDEMRVVRLLARAGMVPTLRHREVNSPTTGR
jgi:hypothetical protein